MSNNSCFLTYLYISCHHSNIYIFSYQVLKMIANRLAEDKKHVVGGTVLVNGIDRLDKEYYWSVSLV